MAHRSNFPPPNPYSRGMPGTGYRSQSPRQHSPAGGAGMHGFSGSPRGRGGGQYYSPRGFSPNRGPSPQHMHHGRGSGQFSPSNYQQSPYTPGSNQQFYQQWEGGNRGRGGRGRGGGGGYRSPRGRGSHGGGGSASVEQYYKHSMVEDPWRTLANSQSGTAGT
ncbi:uncharacterized protein [Amphiura filiformis]|uniref:uncharacterized protein n=1 Tax=Amphiura filiformis TaxID=82378 RepID=UPI003B213F3C